MLWRILVLALLVFVIGCGGGELANGISAGCANATCAPPTPTMPRWTEVTP